MELKDLLTKVIDIFDKEFDKFPLHEIPELSKLTIVQAHYLEAISRIDNPTISELTKEFNVTKPTVSVIVDKLVRSGYIVKEKSDYDGRIFYLRLSKKGKELYKIYKEHDEKTYSAFVAEIRKTLTEDELKSLTEILQKLIERF
jgi:DNA-binding MarR family transcriptional regulator